MAAMARSAHAQLQMVMATLMGREHPAAQEMDVVIRDLMAQDTKLEEYSPCEPILKPKIPALLIWWVQIRLLEWIARKWESGGRETFPDLEEIWRKIDL